MIDELAIMFGLTPEGAGILIGFLLAFSIALFVGYELKKHNREAKDISLMVFFAVFFIISIISGSFWILLILGLLLYGIVEYFYRRRN